MLSLQGFTIESGFSQMTVASEVVASFVGKTSVMAGRGVDYPDLVRLSFVSVETPRLGRFVILCPTLQIHKFARRGSNSAKNWVLRCHLNPLFGNHLFQHGPRASLKCHTSRFANCGSRLEHDW